MPTDVGEVLIRENGRSGTIEYREGEKTLSLGWEFGGTVVAIIFTNAKNWDTAFPWAAGRMSEILSRIGAEVVRQKAPACMAEVDASDGEFLYIRGPIAATAASKRTLHEE